MCYIFYKDNRLYTNSIMDFKAKYQQFFEINQKLWDQKTDVHVRSEFYDNESFIQGRNSLDNIVMENLGDVKDKRILHLQCHFGQDSISLARMGAEVTAIDLSPKSIDFATKMNNELGTSVHFICCNVYDVLEHVTGTFDMVFSTFGTICWLPDLKEWARIINAKLKPNGKLYLVEFHPTLYMFDFKSAEIKYDYFNNPTKAATLETETGTYTDFNEDMTTDEAFWSHSLEEVLMPLLQQNLQLSLFKEYDYSPYPCFENMKEKEKGQHVFGPFDTSIPHVVSVQFQKP